MNKMPVSECCRCGSDFFWRRDGEVLCRKCWVVVKSIIRFKARGCLVIWKEASDVEESG